MTRLRELGVPGRPAVMGILNVTPDSFSDGGRFAREAEAIAAGLEMLQRGADIVDVGGESTRPGAEPVAEEEELGRVLPVIEAIAGQGGRVSVDTTKPSVAAAALDAGARLINDVSGLADPEMVRLAASTGCEVCIMHRQGGPKTMQLAPTYGNVVLEVLEILTARAKEAERAGVGSELIWIDPGIGFGKTLTHNLELLANLHRFVETGYAVLLGVSRKGFLGSLSGSANPGERDDVSHATGVLAQLAGVRCLRVHDVVGCRRALDVVSAIQAHR